MRTQQSTSKVAALEGLGLSLSFGGTRALTDVSISLERGEILGVVGPNGAGKSTLVNILSGHLRQSTGLVRVVYEDGHNLNLSGRGAAHYWRAGVARSFQGMRLYSRLTVFENVLAGALGSRVKEGESLEVRALEVLARLGLQGRVRETPDMLSIGQSKLVGVARALVSSPAFILLDEPLAGLDRDEAMSFVEEIQSVAAELNSGILLIDHDLESISRACSRIVVLDQGAVIASGTCDVFDDVKVQSAYMGTQSPQAFAKHWRASKSTDEGDVPSQPWN